MNLGVALAVLQIAFSLTWVIYVIYLPAMAVQAGLPAKAVPWILLLDQAIFIVCDWATGVHADRVAARLGRIGPRLAAVTLVSGAAFLLMPWLAPAGSPALFVALVVVWSATSSALRAPPFILIGRHAPAPRQPWLAGLYLLGLGLAAALAPYLGASLKRFDPRLPFAIATVAVVATTLVLAAAERRASTRRDPRAAVAVPAAVRRTATIATFGACAILFALGFQWHFSVNTAPMYLRFAQPGQLEHLMPVFWIGFNLAVLPATLLAKRFSTIAVMAVAGVLGTLAAGLAPHAPTLGTLVALQLCAGAAWGAVLTGAFAAALEAGRPGLEGSATGMLFSMLAVAAFARIAFVSAGLPQVPAVASWAPSGPALLWAGASLLAVLIALSGTGSRARSA